MRAWITILFLVPAACGGKSGLGGDGSSLTDTISDPGADDPLSDPPPDIAVDDAAEILDVTDPVPGCEPQNVWAEGECTVPLPGMKWDGANCVPLGSGCGCAGDCGALYDTIESCVEARRHCYEGGCDPQPVAEDSCFDCEASTVGVFWTGRECFVLVACGCVGEGCGRRFDSMAECEAVQAGCGATLCLETGGAWFPEVAGFSGFPCGVPQTDGSPVDACNCGPGRNFDAGPGCVEDASCTARDACLATGGSWHPASECICGFTCGFQNACGACLDSCNCGPHRTFDEAAGCLPDALCERVSDEDLCKASGGHWIDNNAWCGHYICGVPNTIDDCITPGCDCGDASSFDPVRGCFLDETCFYREVRQECTGWASDSTCRPGLMCCAHCPVPGCFWCQDPCCSLSTDCMEDGCPMPPP
jgi:hypothetical protein